MPSRRLNDSQKVSALPRAGTLEGRSWWESTQPHPFAQCAPSHSPSVGGHGGLYDGLRGHPEGVAREC